MLFVCVAGLTDEIQELVTKTISSPPINSGTDYNVFFFYDSNATIFTKDCRKYSSVFTMQKIYFYFVFDHSAHGRGNAKCFRTDSELRFSVNFVLACKEIE